MEKEVCWELQLFYFISRGGGLYYKGHYYFYSMNGLTLTLVLLLKLQRNVFRCMVVNQVLWLLRRPWWWRVLVRWRWGMGRGQVGLINVVVVAHVRGGPIAVQHHVVGQGWAWPHGLRLEMAWVVGVSTWGEGQGAIVWWRQEVAAWWWGHFGRVVKQPWWGCGGRDAIVAPVVIQRTGAAALVIKREFKEKRLLVLKGSHQCWHHEQPTCMACTTGCADPNRIWPYISSYCCLQHMTLKGREKNLHYVLP